MALLPLAASAVGGYLLYHHVIARPLANVVHAQQAVLIPLEGLQVAFWNVSESVIDFALEGEARYADEARQELEQIDAAFDRLAAAAALIPECEVPVTAAREAWGLTADLARSLLRGGGGMGRDIEAFEHTMGQSARLIEECLHQIRLWNERTHQRALTALGHADEIALGAFLLSALLMVLGVIVINRALVESIDKLVSGAMRISAGEREQPIEVSVPPELANVAGAFNAMTKKIVEQEEALSLAARTDGLTGLLNRREFDAVLAQEVVRTDRFGTTFGLILMDIDHFKVFNDSFGHPGGDAALRTVARLLQGTARASDRVCRIGGEEFAMILPGGNAQTVQDTAERVRAVIAAQRIDLPDGRQTDVTASFGTAVFPAGGVTAQDLFDAADKALYSAKSKGRNLVIAAIPPHVDQPKEGVATRCKGRCE